MKAYTDLPGFEALVLEESYVLGIQAVPGSVTFEVDLVLTPQHTQYAPPPLTERECFRKGSVRFGGVQRLVWDRQGNPPATDATGEIDYGHINSLEWQEGTFRLEGDWGRMELSATHAEVIIAA